MEQGSRELGEIAGLPGSTTTTSISHNAAQTELLQCKGGVRSVAAEQRKGNTSFIIGTAGERNG